MSVRTVSAILFSKLLAWQSAGLAESEQDKGVEADETQASLAEAVQTPVFTEPLDFRRPAIADGLSGPPSSRAFNAFGIGMFVVAGADLASTEIGLTRPGVYEANPTQGSRNVRILTHVAAPAFMYWVTDKLHDRGKRKAALIARIGFNVAYSYIVMHNLRTASTLP